jgi:prophage regulatory protein
MITISDGDGLFTLHDLEKRFSRNRKTIWRWWKNKTFPSPIQINGRAIGWRKSVIYAFERGEWEHD